MIATKYPPEHNPADHEKCCWNPSSAGKLRAPVGGAVGAIFEFFQISANPLSGLEKLPGGFGQIANVFRCRTILLELFRHIGVIRAPCGALPILLLLHVTAGSRSVFHSPG